MCLTFSHFIESIPAAESVVYRSGQRGGMVSLNGQILDWTRQELVFAVTSPETTTRIPADSLVAFSAEWHPVHQQARTAYAEHRYADAEALFKQVRGENLRAWEKREVFAGLVRSSINQQKWVDALHHFDEMLLNSPYTLHQELLPLHWHSYPLSDDQRIWALSVLDGTDARHRLIAASWLLGTSQYVPRVEDTLKALLTEPVPEIRILAQAQRWRIELGTETLSDSALKRWERQRKDVPDELAAGPEFVLGQGHEKLFNKAVATSHYLWLTTMDTCDQQLVYLATSRAASLLEELGQPAEAALL
ncbi:MAG: hypothetical protein KDA78_18355, partial [Planctomycetaceae bacterium]|nr:hypothetical protein [Planctomycetaceae bacterium]